MTRTQQCGIEKIELFDGGQLLWIPEFLPRRQTAQLFQTLQTNVAWEQSTITVFGRQVPIPRLNAWYGDTGCDYRYSGRSFVALPWIPDLQALQQDINARFALSLNSVLVNLYRDGADAMGWHSDNEPALGVDPAIASLSLGGSRRFLLRPKKDSVASNQLEFDLADGSLLLMTGSVQRHWRHSVPRTRKPAASRINMTFREIVEAT